jgi:hypothetical protein
MAAAASPFGLTPVKNLIDGSSTFNTETVAYTADIARAIAIGDLISVGASALGIPSTSPTTTVGANSPIGIVKGISFTAAPGGSLLSTATYLPANAITAGYAGILIEYYASPFMIMKVQASANTGVDTAVGKNAALVMTAASATLKKSLISLNAATLATTATLAVKIIGLASPSTDTYPEYFVIWNPGVHSYANTTGV